MIHSNNLHALLCLLLSTTSNAAFSSVSRAESYGRRIAIYRDNIYFGTRSSDVRTSTATCTIIPDQRNNVRLYSTLFPFGDKDENEEEDDDEIEMEFDVEAFLEEKRAKEATGGDSSAAAPSDGDEEEESKNLTDKFFQNLRIRNIGRNTKFGRRKAVVLPPDDDEAEGEAEDYEDPDDDQVRNITASEMNIFLGRDDGAVGKLAGNVTFTNKEMYASLKERILESPQTFRRLTEGADDNDGASPSAFDDDGLEKPYAPPENVPDSELTAGEVVTTVLAALQHNDVPTENRGVEILFGYSSPASILADPIRSPSVEEYAEILSSSASQILYDHSEVIFDKADYSQDKERVFITVRLREGPSDAWTSVNFILSNRSSDDCWLIDSHLIRPKGLRRGKRW